MLIEMGIELESVKQEIRNAKAVAISAISVIANARDLERAGTVDGAGCVTGVAS
ncbi:hypothetical protein GCM10009688_24490 [Arthrobacter gandavensis]|uniref:Uncharacterized protein n=1 Tax=Arthrobacter gandavensis TaxID=169960 RepID=A0ABP5AQQ7_9MICC|nr:hypothetical protein [Arthrobacter citreus]